VRLTLPIMPGQRKKLSDSEFIAHHLDKLYSSLNKREYVHPDPLEFLYDYPDPRDREVVALIASSLAYGKVTQILKSISCILCKLPEPYLITRDSSFAKLSKTFRGFKHRFTTDDEIASMLHGAGRVIKKYDSLENCFASESQKVNCSIPDAFSGFVSSIKTAAHSTCDTLLPDPGRGSACKRLNLFMRWMVRHDEVDPGGWYNLSPAGLVVPLDVHMHRISRALGFTCRAQADMRTAVEITEAFRKFAPDDPVKYDFSLTRLGIRDDMSPDVFIKVCKVR
jgi:uncharacterized protein (TIGR02757 family)